MKKKILLVLLVVLMVGILAFSVFACNGGDDDKKKPSKDDTTTVDPDDEIEDVDYLTPMVTDVIGALDNTIATVTKIDSKASVSASIYVDVAVGEETYKVNLDIAGSIDQTAKAKNWAQIDANVLGVEVSLFAVNNGEVEDLYIAQNILNEEKEWNKLSQFEQANVLNNLACNSIIDLVKGIDATTKKQLSDGYINGVAGGILGMLSIVDGMNILVPGAGAGEDFATTDGYNAALNVGGIAALLEMDFVADLLVSLPADYHGIISMAIDLLLGADLEFVTDEETGAVSATFTPGTAENTPTIELGFAVEDDLFTGLALSYAKGDISVQFGINNISLSADSKAYNAPYGSTEPDELAIALSLDLVAPGISAEAMNAQVNIYPNVAMSFDEDGYVALDLSKLYAVADLTIGEDVYTIAEYNVDGNEDLILDLTAVADVLESNVPATQFKVPVNLQEKFDNMIADEKAKKNTSSDVAQNAINGKNVVDYVIEDIVPGLFNEDGSFNIGGVVGVLGQVGAIVEELTPIFETEGLFDAAIEGSTASATLNLEVLMDALLTDNGIIDGITGEWNSFDLYKYVTTVEGEGEDAVETTAVEYVEGMTIAELLAEENVLENVVALVNTLIYENYVKNFVPATEGEEALSYADYFASEDAITELTEDMITGTLYTISGSYVDADKIYENLTVSVDAYAQKGIGFGIGATIGGDNPYTEDTVETAGELYLGLGLKIIENKPVETYSQKINFVEQTGNPKVMDWMTWKESLDTSVVLSTDTGKDGGKLLKEVALILAMDAAPIVSNYVDKAYVDGVAMYGKDVLCPAAATLTDGTVALSVSGKGQYYFVINLDADATVTMSVAADTKIKNATYCENGFFGISPAMPLVGSNAGYNEATYDYDILVTEGSFSAVAGELIISVEANGAGVVTVTVA